jgi:hypothetical protein
VYGITDRFSARDDDKDGSYEVCKAFGVRVGALPKHTEEFWSPFWCVLRPRLRRSLYTLYNAIGSKHANNQNTLDDCWPL